VSPARGFFPILAAAALVILFHQLSDLFALLAGTDIHVPASRMRLVTAVGSREAALITADVLAIWAAVGRLHGRALRGLGGAHYAAGALALLAAALFLADAGAVAGAVGRAEISTYRMVVLRTQLLLLAGGAAALIAARRLSAFARLPGSRTPDPSPGG
jgi:hypothetical protein